jgi:hypothetical protein
MRTGQGSDQRLIPAGDQPLVRFPRRRQIALQRKAVKWFQCHGLDAPASVVAGRGLDWKRVGDGRLTALVADANVSPRRRSYGSGKQHRPLV